jgi:hypothetical protein
MPGTAGGTARSMVCTVRRATCRVIVHGPTIAGEHPALVRAGGTGWRLVGAGWRVRAGGRGLVGAGWWARAGAGSGCGLVGAGWWVQAGGCGRVGVADLLLVILGDDSIEARKHHRRLEQHRLRYHLTRQRERAWKGGDLVELRAAALARGDYGWRVWTTTCGARARHVTSKSKSSQHVRRARSARGRRARARAATRRRRVRSGSRRGRA